MLMSLILSCYLIGICMGDEPRCPKVDFDKTLIEMLVRLEFKVNQTNDKLSVLEETVKQTIDKLTVSEETLNQTKNQLEEMVKQTNDKLSVFEDTVKKEFDELKDVDRRMMNTLTENVQNFKFIEDNLGKEIESRKQNYIEIDTRIDEVEKNITVPRVFFLVTDPEKDLRDNRPIFTKVIHNVGDSYDVPMGIFTCRFAGLYQFAFTYLNKQDTEGATCLIKRNDVTQAMSYARKRLDSATLVSFQYLSIGDTVKVTCREGTYRENGWMWFTGVLIRA